MSDEPPPPPPLPLTKTLHPSDYTALAPELAAVAAYGTDGQASTHRAWEYAMALRALSTWLAEEGAQGAQGALRTLVDVGGGGSHFSAIAQRLYPDLLPVIIDPSLNHSIEDSPAHACFDALTCISVVEHVPKIQPFLKACARHVRPGGLLFFTLDYWDCEGDDTAHFHWMRERIYNRRLVTDLLTDLREKHHCRRFGETDWTFHGNQVYGSYTFLAATLRKDGWA